MRDYEVRCRDRETDRSLGYKKISELPMRALLWLRDVCDWSLPAPEVEAHNEATRDDIRERVLIEITARSLVTQP